jgi:hypothetical protein
MAGLRWRREGLEDRILILYLNKIHIFPTAKFDCLEYTRSTFSFCYNSREIWDIPYFDFTGSTNVTFFFRMIAAFRPLLFFR